MEQHGARVTARARRLLAWTDEVEEAVQEVFVRACQRLGRGWIARAAAALKPGREVRLRSDDELAGWLLAVTTNVCRERQRARGRRAARESGLDPEVNAPTVHAGPAAGLLAGERGARVRAAVRELPDSQREVVVLHYLEGLSIEDVATALELARGTVDTRLSRARRALEAMLGDLLDGLFEEEGAA